MRQGEVDEADGRLEHHLEGLLERVGRHVGPGAGRRTTRVPDEDVEASERLERLCDRALEVLRERDVATHGERADPVGFALEHVAPPSEHRHVCTFARERLGSCEAQAGRCAAHERRAAFQS
jgi:hypothetical protein